jgi:hypothetical protein
MRCSPRSAIFSESAPVRPTDPARARYRQLALNRNRRPKLVGPESAASELTDAYLGHIFLPSRQLVIRARVGRRWPGRSRG